jgi:hypothetical protein
LERNEIEKLLEQLVKERGISDLRLGQCSPQETHFLLALTQVLNVVATPPRKEEGSNLLVWEAEKIAQPYNWSVDIQHASPEDDPTLIDKWCEAKKIIKGPVSEERIGAVVSEASQILEKINQMVAKQKQKDEDLQRRIEQERKGRLSQKALSQF